MLPIVIAEEMTVYIKLLEQRGFLTSGQLFTYLKQLSQHMKIYGREASPFWIYYVNIELLGGYMQCGSYEELDAEIHDWIEVEQSQWNLGGSVLNFMRSFEDGLKDFFSYMNAKAKDMTVDEFVHNPSLYCTSGSSRKRMQPGRKTKWTTSLILGPIGVKQWMLDGRVHTQDIVALKRELGKVRPVIAANDENNYRMSYISYLLDGLLNGHPNSIPNESSEMILVNYKLILDMMSTNDYVFVSIDQEHFDHNPSSAMLIMTLDYIERYVLSYCLEDKLNKQHILSLIKSRLLNNNVYFRNKVYHHTKGIESGWRWTSLLDTVINYAEQFIVARQCLLLGVQVVKIFCQGDDALIAIRKIPGIDVGKVYNDIAFSMGMPVNVMKYYTDDYRAEFLRKVFMSNEVRGYPARALPGILWNKPNNEVINDYFSLAKSIVTNWVQLIQRLQFKNEYIDRSIVSDVKGACKLRDSDSIIRSWIGTPSCMGGCGVQYYRNYEHFYSMKQDLENYTQDVIVPAVANTFFNSNSKQSFDLFGPMFSDARKRSNCYLVEVEPIHPHYIYYSQTRTKHDSLKYVEKIDPMWQSYLFRSFVMRGEYGDEVKHILGINNYNLAVRWSKMSNKVRSLLVDDKLQNDHSLLQGSLSSSLYLKFFSSYLLSMLDTCNVGVRWLYNMWVSYLSTNISYIEKQRFIYTD